MKIFIGCSSSDDLSYEYYITAIKAVNPLVVDNDLVFGEYNAGVMGLCYDIFKEKNRKITAIVPETYKDNLKGKEKTKWKN